MDAARVFREEYAVKSMPNRRGCLIEEDDFERVQIIGCCLEDASC